MSKKDEALKLALEALKSCWKVGLTDNNWKLVEASINAIREALADQPAQPCGYPYCGCNSKAWCKLERMAENARELGLDYEPAQQEPVAWRYKPKGDGGWGWSFVELKPIDAVNYTMEPLYTSPQSKPWVGLTDEEINKTFETKVWDARRSYARAIEAKLREKNNG